MTDAKKTGVATLKSSLDEYNRNREPVFVKLETGDFVINQIERNLHGIIAKQDFDEWKLKRREFGSYNITHDAEVSWNTESMSNSLKREKITNLISRDITVIFQNDFQSVDIKLLIISNKNSWLLFVSYHQIYQNFAMIDIIEL